MYMNSCIHLSLVFLARIPRIHRSYRSHRSYTSIARTSDTEMYRSYHFMYMNSCRDVSLVYLYVYEFIQRFIARIHLSLVHLARIPRIAISRLLKMIGLLCRISSLLQGSFAKETYHFVVSRVVYVYRAYSCRDVLLVYLYVYEFMQRCIARIPHVEMYRSYRSYTSIARTSDTEMYRSYNFMYMHSCRNAFRSYTSDRVMSRTSHVSLSRT